MEVVKETKEHTIFKKRSGRYGVQNHRGRWINGEEKTKVLGNAGLIKLTAKKAEETEETTTEDAKTE